MPIINEMMQQPGWTISAPEVRSFYDIHGLIHPQPNGMADCDALSTAHSRYPLTSGEIITAPS